MSIDHSGERYLVHKAPNPFALILKSTVFLFGNDKIFLYSILLVSMLSVAFGFFITLFNAVFLDGVTNNILNLFLVDGLGNKILAFLSQIIIFLVSVFITGCFVLSWHRIVLRSAEVSEVCNPFGLKDEKKKFILTFFQVSILLSLLLVLWLGLAGGLIYLIAYYLFTRNIYVSILVVVLTFFIFYPWLKNAIGNFFVLPPKSIGLEVDFFKGRDYAQGLKFRWVVAIMAIYLSEFVIFWLLGYGVFEPLSKLLSFGKDALYSNALIETILSIPFIIMGFAFLACSVGVLSYYYQWSKKYNYTQ